MCGSSTVQDGYCDAYCEALDCDGAPEGTVETCVAVFDAHKKEAGTAPPCETDLTCPCVAAFQFDWVLGGPEPECETVGTRLDFESERGEIYVDEAALTCGRGDSSLRITYEEAGECRLRMEQACG